MDRWLTNAELNKMIRVSGPDGMMRRGISLDYLDLINAALKELQHKRNMEVCRP